MKVYFTPVEERVLKEYIDLRMSIEEARLLSQVLDFYASKGALGGATAMTRSACAGWSIAINQEIEEHEK